MPPAGSGRMPEGQWAGSPRYEIRGRWRAEALVCGTRYFAKAALKSPHSQIEPSYAASVEGWEMERTLPFNSLSLTLSLGSGRGDSCSV